ncbi:DUF4870 domain-containing protein [Croceivirga thetidis]|uniref:DUF4870 domain-containing protein n=1 Tax=Croceivirga thetidis TaxID=2721623 RepID=A0ABX1GQ39_9FLAO|nr:DUF4870 domain-containing protein [Croceivirga thetidis]NKI32027.1 DUF4870 domain-containing protein [Croceivirga thetidis]
MELVSTTSLRKDNTLVAITHLTQLLHYVTGFGGFIVPLIIWATSRNNVEGMDEHGKSIINFQLSMLLYIVLSIPAILLLGLGILTFIGVGIIGFILPIINAIKASNGEPPSYFLTIKFF